MLSTVIVGLAVLLAVALAARSIWRDKKSGKSCCGGGCKSCSGLCCKSFGPENPPDKNFGKDNA